MKTSRLLPTGGLLLAALSLPAPLPAREPAPAPAPAPKTHVLFMGVDLEVQRDKKLYRVEDVVGSEFKIRIGQKEAYVPTRNRTTGLKVVNSLKLTSASVQLDDVHAAETYTPANDPRRKFAARTGTGSALRTAQSVSEFRLSDAEQSLEKAKLGPREYQIQFETIIDQEKSTQSTLNQQIGSDYGSIPTMANDLANELAKGDYDAVEVLFKVSSPVPLRNPYMVVLVEFQPRNAKPGETSLLIHAKALDPIDAQPQQVVMREGGLPVGFKLVRHEVHLYSEGREIASNVSSKRVELTRAEAQQYLVIEHVAAHKGGTVAASVVPGTLPPTRRQQLSIEQLNRTCYAKVSKDGDLLGAYVDESGSLQLDDPAILAALGDVFFQPTLVNGKPVEGTARFRLADL